MNKYASYPHRIPGGFGYWAMIRLCRDARPAPIMDEEGKPKVFQNDGDAAKECLRHLVAYMNGREIRGEQFEGGDYSIKAAKFAKADKHFKRSEGAAA